MSKRTICRESFYWLLRYGGKSFAHDCETHPDGGCDIPDDYEVDDICDAIEQHDTLKQQNAKLVESLEGIKHTRWTAQPLTDQAKHLQVIAAAALKEVKGE